MTRSLVRSGMGASPTFCYYLTYLSAMLLTNSLSTSIPEWIDFLGYVCMYVYVCSSWGLMRGRVPPLMNATILWGQHVYMYGTFMSA
ncbi:hypothetical protein F4680DRAFT_428017 [Xylaria scruposa]|nr:hypothetical protein F4680DRAFT_428017 [Xylaria scruposa]